MVCPFVVAEGAMVAIEAGVEDCKDLGTSFDACFFESGSWGTQRKEHKIIQKVASQAQARTRPWDFRFGAMTGVGHVGRQGRLQPGG